jgi:hypothetical protein
MDAERQQYSPEYLAEDIGKTLIIISVLFICLDTIFLGLRFYTQKLTRAPVGLDDFVIPLAWFTHVGLCILGISRCSTASRMKRLTFLFSDGIRRGPRQAPRLQHGERPSDNRLVGEVAIRSGVVISTLMRFAQDISPAGISPYLRRPRRASSKPCSHMGCDCELDRLSHCLFVAMLTV